MNKILLTLLLLTFTTLIYAQQYHIKANITGVPNATKFYVTDSDTETDIDSAVMNNSQFVLEGRLYSSPRRLWVYANSGDNYYYFTLFIGPEKITVKGDAKDFPFDLSITGSKTQDTHKALLDLQKGGIKQRNVLLKEYFAKKSDSLEGKRILKLIAKIDSTDLMIRKNFAQTHLNSYEGLDVLFYLKHDISKDTLAQLYHAVDPVYQQSQFGKRIANYLKVGKILDKGDQSTDFAAVDTEGKVHHLSDHIGKYVLIDFSATYCGPCIASVEELKLIAGKYKEQLSLITFSCDGSKDIWLQGIKRDTPTWLSLWDGKADFGETVMKYGIIGYPTFVLIDPKGKIVSKWTGYGKNTAGKGDLETRIEAAVL